MLLNNKGEKYKKNIFNYMFSSLFISCRQALQLVHIKYLKKKVYIFLTSNTDKKGFRLFILIAQ